MFKKIILWCALISCMSLIFYFSSQEATVSKGTSSRFIKTIVKTIDEQGKLTEEIGKKLDEAKLEIENIVKNKEIKYFPTPSDFVSNKWWKNIKSFKFLALEYTKFLIVFFQYKVLGL